MPYGVVKEVHGETATVILERQDMCGDCHACEMMSGKKSCDLICQNPMNFGVGDEVEVTLTSQYFLKATYITYGVPLLGFIGGLLVGVAISKLMLGHSSDLFLISGAALGTAIGIGIIYWREKKKAYTKFLPHIVGKKKETPIH